MLGLASVFALIWIASSALVSRTLDRDVIIVGVLWAVAFLTFLPVFLALTAKTQERVLELTPAGIRTSIGELHGTVAWSSIAFIHDIGRFVVIGGKNMNVFLVPSRAFPDAAAQEQFLTECQAWASDGVA
jgi:hypothetical protein